MKTIHILKTVGLITALSLSSCDDDNPQQTGLQLTIDPSTLPVSKSITNHFSFKSFTISAGQNLSANELNFVYRSENTLNGATGGSISDWTISEFTVNASNLEQIVQTESDPETEQTIVNAIAFYSSAGGVLSSTFSAIINKYSNNITPTQNEGDQLAHTLDLGVDLQLNLFLLEKTTIDFINNTYTQTGREVIINSATNVVITNQVRSRTLTIAN